MLVLTVPVCVTDNLQMALLRRILRQTTTSVKMTATSSNNVTTHTTRITYSTSIVTHTPRPCRRLAAAHRTRVLNLLSRDMKPLLHGRSGSQKRMLTKWCEVVPALSFCVCS
ncbi:hypothetical protein BaRGS_00037024 [Batillaria attramentaria]|uniref:Secreted protein n=1 Tax=Batillaria attramentaria TaxID=370345 RepID=A0ABD0JAB4_9CAEN